MADIYVELSIILLSVIAVLSVLIVYIVKQTLALKRQYHLQIHQKNADKELWIDRRESDSHILDISGKLGQTNEQQHAETPNLEQMVTFLKRSSQSVNLVENEELDSDHKHSHPQSADHVLNHTHNHTQQHQHAQYEHSASTGRPSLVSESEQYYEQSSTEVNEYSEYCVPNCEPIEHH